MMKDFHHVGIELQDLKVDIVEEVLSDFRDNITISFKGIGD